MSVQGKRILVGVTGGIAAYKIASFVRLLKENGAEVRCIMTPASSAFITPLTLATLSNHPVGIELFDPKSGMWTNHVEWGLWADAFIIAPLTASTLSKLANGNADNFLTATYLSAKCPVFVAPAMDLDMYAHPTTQRNLSQIISDGVRVIPATFGALASGLVGQGRMAEPASLLNELSHHFEKSLSLKDKKVLITAGPTYEAIDPVRFIGNHASGKMGYELARAALELGAEVTLISGPSNCTLSHPNLKLIRVQSAEDMLQATQGNWNDQHLGIFAAAVADYRPSDVADQKIKKNAAEFVITLTKNPDILHWASANRINQQFVVGFALETQDGVNYAKNKLVNKGLDAIVLNQLGQEGVGFGVDTNKVELLFPDNKSHKFELQSKRELAIQLMDILKAYIL